MAKGEQERFPGMRDGSCSLGRQIYGPGYGRFKDSSGERFPPTPPPPVQMRKEPLPRHTRDFRHKYQGPRGPWNLKDPRGGHIKYSYGITMSEVSRHLNRSVPKHCGHPLLKDEPPPSFHRRSTEITEFIENPLRLQKPCVDPSCYYGRQKSDATAQFRILPPAYDPNKAPQWHGRLATWITDYGCLDEEMDRVEKQKALPKVPATQLFY